MAWKTATELSKSPPGDRDRALGRGQDRSCSGEEVDSVAVHRVVAGQDEGDRLILLGEIEEKAFGRVVVPAYDDGVLRAVPHPQLALQNAASFGVDCRDDQHGTLRFGHSGPFFSGPRIYSRRGYGRRFADETRLPTHVQSRVTADLPAPLAAGWPPSSVITR